MKRTLIAILLALAMVLIPVGTAFASNSEGVTIEADPNWVISILPVPADWAIGPVAKATTYWFSGAEPAWDLGPYPADTTNYIENNGTEAVDISITGLDFTGGVSWTLVASATPAVDQAQLVAWSEDVDHNGLAEGVILLNAITTANFMNDLPETALSDKAAWELRLVTPSVFRDAVQKVTTITLLATQSFNAGEG